MSLSGGKEAGPTPTGEKVEFLVGAAGAAAASMIAKRLAGNLLGERAARGPREQSGR